MKQISIITLAISLWLGLSGVELPSLNWTPGSDWVNVKTLGAKGDGVTDDTEVIQGAISAMGEGSVLYFPAGKYVIKKELKMLKTQDVKNEKRYIGTAVYGHGKDTVLSYEGEDGGVLFREMGAVHCLYIGLTFEGNNKASVGFLHDNDKKFETHVLHEYMAFRNFKEYGILSEKNSKDGLSTAEIAFRYNIFENCNVAVSFTSFNDYDYSFDGCYFANNQLAVECINGNFYIRNTYFSKNQCDIEANPEHGCSVRRSVSVGSGKFLNFYNSVAPMTVENCYVADWTGPAAITSRGAPLTFFDNVFKHSAAKFTALQADRSQKVLAANNKSIGTGVLINGNPQISEVKVDSEMLPLSENTCFMPAAVAMSGRHFDVKTDFGAKGDGVADDTAAVLNAVAAAQKFQNDATVYFPKGQYRITQTIELTGSNYRLGGSGLFSKIVFDGKPEADAIDITPAGDIRVENLSVIRKNLSWRRRGTEYSGNVPVWANDVVCTGADIRQNPSDKGSRCTYFNVYVAGKYTYMPFDLGLRLSNLKAHDSVVIDNCEGNIQSHNSGSATIYVPISYEGTVWSKGEGRGGNFVILSRLSTLSRHSLYIEDNNSLIATDYYVEQAAPNTVYLSGNAQMPPGRVTLSMPKLDIANTSANLDQDKNLVTIDCYRGEVNFLATQLYPPKWAVNLDIKGGDTKLSMMSCFFYVKSFAITPKDYAFGLVSSSGNSAFNDTALEFTHAVNDPSAAVNAIKDMRTAGKVDWRISYPNLKQ